jgi:hypothetical protein
LHFILIALTIIPGPNNAANAQNDGEDYILGGNNAKDGEVKWQVSDLNLTLQINIADDQHSSMSIIFYEYFIFWWGESCG